MATSDKRKLHVEFYMRPKLDKKASEEAGREVFKDVEYVRIRFPGDPKRELDQPADTRTIMDPQDNRHRLSYAEQYPDHYALFKKNAEQVIGTPVTVIPGITPAAAATLKAAHIQTGEQLAALSDRDIQKLGMGFRKYVNIATEYLAASAKSADSKAMAAQNAALQAQIDELKAMLGNSNNAPAAEEESLGAGADFETWAEDDLRAYLADLGVEPDGRMKQKGLAKLAHDETVKRQKKAA